MSEILKTPLCSFHESRGAYMAPFGPWLMPIYYESIKKEHLAVRNTAGLFDLCHMGLFTLEGQGSQELLDRLVTNNVSTLEGGQALYSPMCFENGTTVDDLIIYRRDRYAFLIIVNASNIDKDFDWISKHNTAGCELKNISDSCGLIGLQGPRSFEILEQYFGCGFEDLEYFNFLDITFEGMHVTLARTGYTGEKGVEIIVPAENAMDVWEGLLSAGGDDLVCAGLGARDSLRLEMGYSLYGHELTDGISPIESGLGWTVDFSKEDFIGRSALLDQKNNPVRRLCGLELEGRQIARHGVGVFDGTTQVGTITSGVFSPSLNKSIALALVDAGCVEKGREFAVNVRGDRMIKAVVCPRSFYKSSVR